MQTPDCRPRIWTFDRYSPAIVELMDFSVTQVKKQGQYQNIELVGYSGGATIALLLAARRDDVISVRTVAGNLDPAFTNDLHGVSKMPDAMNPSDFRRILAHIPQVHFYGTNDRVIPDKVSQHYSAMMGNSDWHDFPAGNGESSQWLGGKLATFIANRSRLQ